MSKNAAAIVRISPDRIRATFIASEGDESVRVGASGAPFRMVALEDATVVDLESPIAAEPDEHAARLVMLLGDLLEAHEEPRGVPIFPSSYELGARTWDAALEELGEAADWVRFDEKPASVADLLGAFGLGNADMSSMQDALANMDQSALLSSALQMAQQMVQREDFADMAKRMRDLSASAPEDPLAALRAQGGRMEGFPDMGGLDFEALTREAQRMLQQNPEMEKMIRDMIGSGEGEDEDGEDDEEK